MVKKVKIPRHQDREGKTSHLAIAPWNCKNDQHQAKLILLNGKLICKVRFLVQSLFVALAC